MKRAFLLLLLMFLAAVPAISQVSWARGSMTAPTTVAALPVIGNSNLLYDVRDALTATSCTTGGGTFRIVCHWDGAAYAWVAAGSGTVTSVSGTANQISVATGTTTPVISLTSSVIIPGSMTAQSFIGSGSGAGYLELIQGTAPSLGTTSFQLVSPASITSYQLKVPSAASTGIPLWTNAANVVTESIVAPGTSGNVLTSNGSTWTSAAAGGGLTIGTTTVTSGTGGRCLYETSGNKVGEVSGCTSDGTTITLIGPILGTPASGTLTNATGLPVAGLSNLGSNVGTFLITPSSANLFAAITDETGSGVAVGGTSPQFTTGIGIGVAAVTGNSIKALEGTAPTNAAGSDALYPDSTAHRWKVKNNSDTADTMAVFTDNLSVFAATTSAQLRGVVNDELGSGAALFNSALSPDFTGTFTAVNGTLTATPTTGNGFSVSSSTVTTGNVVNVAATGTVAASNTKTALNVSTSGANGTTTQTTYGAQVSNTSTGTSSTNIGLLVAASGGTSNFGIKVTATNAILGGNFTIINDSGNGGIQLKNELQNAFSLFQGGTIVAHSSIRSNDGSDNISIGIGQTSSGSIETVSAGYFGLSSSSTQSNTGQDTFMSRSAAGVMRFGTTSSNALGSILSAGATFSGALINSGITADTAHADTSVCQDTTTHQFYSGTGTLGVCLGTSSARFKHDITEADEGLNEILKLRPINFLYNYGYGDSGSRLQYGFTAEDVHKVLPRLVALDVEGHPNSVDILGMVPLIIRALQQQQSEIDVLKARP